jgi:hypothetical protein
MDARVKPQCERCRKLLPSKTRGRPQRFCSDACRKAAGRLNGQERSEAVPSTGAPFSCLQHTDLPNNFCPKIEISEKKPLTFEQVNDVTWKLTDGEGINVPTSHGQWAGYRTTKAIAWVIEVAPGYWFARYQSQSSRPTSLKKAKARAVGMATGSVREREVADPIRRLNFLRALVEDIPEPDA